MKEYGFDEIQQMQQKALERVQGREDDPCYKGSFFVADMMIANLDRYGVPCAAWAE